MASQYRVINSIIDLSVSQGGPMIYEVTWGSTTWRQPQSPSQNMSVAPPSGVHQHHRKLVLPTNHNTANSPSLPGAHWPTAVMWLKWCKMIGWRLWWSDSFCHKRGRKKCWFWRQRLKKCLPSMSRWRIKVVALDDRWNLAYANRINVHTCLH